MRTINIFFNLIINHPEKAVIKFLEILENIPNFIKLKIMEIAEDILILANLNPPEASLIMRDRIRDKNEVIRGKLCWLEGENQKSSTTIKSIIEKFSEASKSLNFDAITPCDFEAFKVQSKMLEWVERKIDKTMDGSKDMNYLGNKLNEIEIKNGEPVRKRQLVKNI